MKAPFLCFLIFLSVSFSLYSQTTVTPNIVKLLPPGGIQMFTVDAEGDWDIEIPGDESWIVATKIDLTSFSVEYNDNVSDASRSASIVINSGGSSDTVYLFQEAPYLFFLEDTCTIAAISDQESFPPLSRVIYNIPYTIETFGGDCYDDGPCGGSCNDNDGEDIWFSFGGCWEGYDSINIFIVSPQKSNISTGIRQGKVVVSSDFGVQDSIVIKQDYWNLNIQPDTLVFSFSNGETQAIYLEESTSSEDNEIFTGSANIVENCDWLSPETTYWDPFDYDPIKINFTTIESNLTNQSRFAEISLTFNITSYYGGEGSISKSIIAVQEPELPDGWNISPSDYEFTGEIVSKVLIYHSEADTGYLGAFVNGECRGIAQPIFFQPSNQYVFPLFCYSDVESGEIIHFKYFDNVNGKTYDLVDSIEFVADMTLGDASTPTELNYYKQYRKKLYPGWSIFSINVRQPNMSLGNIIACNTQGDYIKNQFVSSIYYDDFGWFGGLDTLDVTTAYKVKMLDTCEAIVNGKSVENDSILINLESGWNWISFLSMTEMPVEEALSSLTPSQNDYIKNRTKSAMYYDGYGWFGTLTDLIPGEGYILRVNEPDTIDFKYIEETTQKKVAFKSTKEFENASIYRYNGSVTARVYKDGISMGTDSDLLFAYVDEDCRGVVNGVFFKPAESYIFPIMIFSNVGSGEEVTFKYYDSMNDQFYNCKESILFENNMIVSDANNTYDLSFSTTDIIKLQNSGINSAKLSVYPNPFINETEIEYSILESSYISLAVYDMLGRQVVLLSEGFADPGSYSISLNSGKLTSGTYIIRLITDKFQLNNKIVLQE